MQNITKKELLLLFDLWFENYPAFVLLRCIDDADGA